MRINVSPSQVVTLQPGASEKVRLLAKEDESDVTDVVGVVDGFGVIDAELDRVEFVELLAGDKPYRLLVGREEGLETWVEPLVPSVLANDCDLDDKGDDGVDEIPDDIELFFASETSAVVMLPWARVVFPLREE